MIKIIFFSFFVFLNLSSYVYAQNFISIKNNQFSFKDKNYSFIGTNFWQGMNLGSIGESGNRQKLIKELDHLKKLGIKNLRILALSEGTAKDPYRIIPAVLKSPTSFDENLLVGLDFLLVEMKKREMSAVVCLGNFWPWSGGFAQWVNWFEKSSIPYPPPHPNGSWSVFQEYSSRFYANPSAVKAYQNAVAKIVNRKNTISKIDYIDDPTIMSWQLANEPRGAKRRKEFLAWVDSTAKLIKSLDKNHLVTIGSEGETLNPEDAGNDFIADHSSLDIDYATMHLWVENWGIYNPHNAKNTFSDTVKFMNQYIDRHVDKAKVLNKPLVMEEFGMARDNRSMDPSSPTTMRDTYYDLIFTKVIELIKKESPISGINFWAWSGTSLPKQPYGSLWKKGADFLGDPPHEEQGWYGVYSHDESTLKIIKKYTNSL